MIQRASGGFVAVVPRIAKSAATLLVTGADGLLMGCDAELGPLDAQIMDRDTEDYGSALNEVQALERLNVVALDQIDQTMFLLLARTGKKTDVLLPRVLDFVASMMRPLVEKIDTVHYTQRSRVLKVGEDYAVRLLQKRVGDDAPKIARDLVNNYPEHGFIIDRDEASRVLQLPTTTNNGAVTEAIDDLERVLNAIDTIAIGQLVRRVR